MHWNPDVTRFGWLIVAVVLGWSGMRHMIDMEIYGRVRLPGTSPLLAGGTVFVIGLVELAIGIFCLYRAIRHS